MQDDTATRRSPLDAFDTRPYLRRPMKEVRKEHSAEPDQTLPHRSRLQPGDEALTHALSLVRHLRAHCPWDAKQTPRTLRPYLLEEAHEVADAIGGGDDDALREELGDLLLNVAFQLVLAEERGAFSTTDVVELLERKMVRRHPHIYGDAEGPPDWESIKAAERGVSVAGAPDGDPFTGVSRRLEPLSLAARMQERMAAFGFDWPDLVGPLECVRDEARELKEAVGEADLASIKIGDADAATEEEAGDLLFAAVNAVRRAGAHPANALLMAIEKFERRCRSMVELAQSRGMQDWRALGLDTLDALWDEVKVRERSDGGHPAGR